MKEEETFSLFNLKIIEDELNNDANNTTNYDLFSPSDLIYDLNRIEHQNKKNNFVFIVIFWMKMN